MVKVSFVLLGLLLVACQAHEVSPTQLMLTTGSDLPAQDFASIVFRVKGRDGQDLPPSKPRTPEAGKPVALTLALLHSGGSKLGPVTVSVVGVLRDGREHARTHVVSFQRGRTLTVPLHLMQRCFDGAVCPAGQECSELGCTPQALNSLDTWTGEMPEVEAVDGGAQGDGSPAPEDAGKGPHDAGPVRHDDASVPEDAGGPPLCDEQSDLTEDAHCGSCENDCTAMSTNAPHSRFRCVDMACAPRCQANWGNCDLDLSTGCETDLLTTRKHCGMCANKCRGNQTCVAGACQ